MSFFKKIGAIISQVFLLLTIPLLWGSVLYILCFGIGLFMTYGVLSQFKEGKKDSFPFMEERGFSFSSGTRNVEVGGIYTSSGHKVASITSRETYDDSSIFDNFKWCYVDIKGLAVYIILYPFLRIISLVASILALFTNKFYVRFTEPYANAGYNEFLHCYFDIIYIKDEDVRADHIEETKNSPEEAITIFGDKLPKWLLVLPPVGPIFFVISLCRIFIWLGHSKKMLAAFKDLYVTLIPTIIYCLIPALVACGFEYLVEIKESIKQ